MKNKIICSVVVALVIAGTSSFSVFATMSNGTVVIGNKFFDLAYANDIANRTEITNAIVQGGAIYVKDFSGNWIDNNTGKIVQASVIPGEDLNETTTELDIIKDKSIYNFNMKDNTGLNYSVNIFSDDNQIVKASIDPIIDEIGFWPGANEGDQLSIGHYKIAVSKDGETDPKIYDVSNNEKLVLNLNKNSKLIRVHKNIQEGQPDFLLIGTPSTVYNNYSDIKIYYIKDGILKLANFSGENHTSVITNSLPTFFNQLENNVFETSIYNNSILGGEEFGYYMASQKFDLGSGVFTYLSSRFMSRDDYFNYSNKEDIVYDTVITFPDTNLEQVIREIINKPTGNIYKSDVEKITEISGESKEIKDISGLQYLTNLQSLDLACNFITDISPLKNLIKLKDIFLYQNNVKDITPLGNLTKLESLNLEFNETSDITPLRDLINLQSLYLIDNNVKDISPLKNMTKLSELFLQGNQITDINTLKSLINLKQVYLSDNPITDISTLKSMINLDSLDLDNIQTNDISALKDLTNLTILSLEFNKISDISTLEGLTNLQALYLRDNQIKNIDALKGLTKLDTLYLDNNQISDYTPVESYYNNLINPDFNLDINGDD